MPEEGVTVIVPTLDRGEFLVNTVTDLLAQTYRPLEIRIVDQSDEPSEALARIVAEHSDIVHWHRIVFRGLSAARNHGWQHAAYQGVLFVDDDVRCGPQLAAEHARALSLPGVAVVAGGINDVVRAEDTVKGPGKFHVWTASAAGGFESRGEREVDHARGCNFSVRRCVLEQLGGFDESLQVGAALYEETEFCLRAKRAGYRIYFNGAARLTHLAAGDGGCRVRDVTSYVYGLAHNRAVLIRRHLSWFHAPTAVVRLGILCLSYAAHYRVPSAVFVGLKGLARGWRAAAQPPICGDYRRS